MSIKEFFYLRKSDRQVILLFLSVAALALGGIFLLDHFGDNSEENEPPLADSTTVFHNNKEHGDSTNGKDGKRKALTYQVEERQVERFAFDPNTADSTQLLRLGLQPWQVRNIYKYRAAGGIYRKKEDFAKLYGLTVKEYRELEPYIRISPDYQPASTLIKEETHERDTLRFPRKLAEGETIDLNTADTTILRKVPGIGVYYAREITRYRRWLGGFANVNQLDEIEGFPKDAKKFFTIGTTPVTKLNLNKLSLDQLKRHPYLNYYQAKAIIDYRRQHGALKSLDDLRLLGDFPEEKRQQLAPYVEF